jgi:hypothetical protein
LPGTSAESQFPENIESFDNQPSCTPAGAFRALCSTEKLYKSLLVGCPCCGQFKGLLIHSSLGYFAWIVIGWAGIAGFPPTVRSGQPCGDGRAAAPSPITCLCGIEIMGRLRDDSWICRRKKDGHAASISYNLHAGLIANAERERSYLAGWCRIDDRISLTKSTHSGS